MRENNFHLQASSITHRTTNDTIQCINRLGIRTCNSICTRRLIFRVKKQLSQIKATLSIDFSAYLQDTRIINASIMFEDVFHQNCVCAKKWKCYGSVLAKKTDALCQMNYHSNIDSVRIDLDLSEIIHVRKDNKSTRVWPGSGICTFRFCLHSHSIRRDFFENEAMRKW